MGVTNSHPSGDAGHHEAYYKGVQCAQEGRYYDAELFFHQAFNAHPSRHFWSRLHSAMNPQGSLRTYGGDDSESIGSFLMEGCGLDTSEVELRVDMAQDILDYIRLAMDVMRTYMLLKADEKTTPLALAYCVSIHQHTEELHILLLLWRKRNEYAIPTTVEKRVIGLIQSTVRYYWVTTGNLYCVLCLLLDGFQYRPHVLQACMVVSNKLQWDLYEMVRQMRHSASAQVIAALMPSIEMWFDCGTNGNTSDDDEAPRRTVVPAMRRPTPLLFNNNNEHKWHHLASISHAPLGEKGFLYQCKYITSATSCAIPLPFKFSLRPPGTLVVNLTNCSSALHHLQTPAHRDTFSYIRWCFTRDIYYTPGNNCHHLSHEIPYYEEKDQTTSGLAIQPLSSHNNANIPFFTQMLDHLSEYIPSPQSDHSNLKSPFAASVAPKTRVNSKLKLQDLGTVDAISVEEAFILQVPGFLLSTIVLQLQKNSSRAQDMGTFLVKSAEYLFGAISAETDLIRSACDAFDCIHN